jgi:hypothetical protein
VEFIAWYRMTDSMPQGGGGGYDRNGITTDYPVPQPRMAVVAYNTIAGYPTVMPDGDVVRLYFRGMNLAENQADSHAWTCYAESYDGGRTFTRPNVGLHEMHGSKENNILLTGEEGTHAFAPFIDTRPGVPPEERYKALGNTREPGGKHWTLLAFVSADGIHWRRMADEPVLTKGAFDSHNVVFWSPTEGKYLYFYRTWSQAKDPTQYAGVRTVSRAESDDFLHWSDPVEMDFNDAPIEELYTSATHPYSRAPHLLIALPKRFNPGRKTLTDEEVERFDVIPKYAGDVSDGVFMTSRDGRRYDRTFMEAFLRPGLDRANWVSRTNMSAWGHVQTGPDELSLYFQHRYTQPGHYLARYTLRLDGFASVRAPWAGGELITPPLTFTGSRLVLNASTSGAGSIRVELQQPDGRPIDGFTLADCPECFGDCIELPVRWGENAELGKLAGKPVRLRFAMRDADLYGLRFAE